MPGHIKEPRMIKHWMVMLAGVALATAASAAPRGLQEPVRVDDAQVVPTKAKKKVVRKTTTTRHTHTESHSSSSSTKTGTGK